MVYSNKFIMCILLNGCPQKELANGVVSIPFEAEYSLRFRNKNNRRAVVQIYIDGENVSGAGYIVNANDYVDIKRHHDVDRSFKFVSLDSPDAVDHGKNGPNDDKTKGTIEARFFLEKEQPKVVYRDVHHHHNHHYPQPPYSNQPMWFGSSETINQCSLGSPGTTSDCSMTGGGITRSMRRRSKSSNLAPTPPTEESQDGCTVEGNLTGQNFRTVWCDTEETHTSLKIFLQGYEESVPTKAKKMATKKVAKKKDKKSEKIKDLEKENEILKKQIEMLKEIRKLESQKD